MKELYIVGNDKDIETVLNFVKKFDRLSKERIYFIDLLPELTEEYIKENGIIRK
jgi:hypothetical protein